jgi:hypothetical protein
MRSLGLLSLALLAPAVVALSAAAANCPTGFKRLPSRFEAFLIGDYDDGSVYLRKTDGWCTCDNLPALDRKFARPVSKEINNSLALDREFAHLASKEINWTCRSVWAELWGSK